MGHQAFELSQQQIKFFEDFGYLRLQCLMADRIQEIEHEFELVWAERGGGHDAKSHDGTSRSCIPAFIDQSEALSSLVDDQRVIAVATALLGADFNYMGSDGNFYVGDTRWHSDGAHVAEEPQHIKLAFYLDSLTASTGALRVIPGSHRLEDNYSNLLSNQIKSSQERWALHGREVPSVVVETQPGDVALFNHNTKHAAFGGGERHRMFTINLSQRYPENRLENLRGYIGGAARFWIDRYYGEKMMNTASQERMRHLEQVMSNDDDLAELSRQARVEMSEPSRG